MARINSMARLKEEMGAIENAIQEIDRKEGERVEREKEAQEWTGYLRSKLQFWTVQWKTEDILEQIQVRASKTIQLGRAKNQLTKVEQEHQQLLTMQKEMRERERKSRMKKG